MNKTDILFVHAGVPANCQFVQADFMKLPFEDNSFDHVYTIEAVCHAPDKVSLYFKDKRCCLLD